MKKSLKNIDRNIKTYLKGFAPAAFPFAVFWFILTVFYHYFSISSGGVFAYAFYLVGLWSFIVIIEGIYCVLKYTTSSIKLKIQLAFLIIMAFFVIDLNITSIHVMRMTSNYIERMTILERNLLGKRVNYSTKYSYSMETGEFFKHYKLSKTGGVLNRYRVLEDASRGINLYIVNKNIIEKAMLFNGDSIYNIIIINPETRKRRVPERRYRKVMGGTEPYFASLPEETVLWKFIDVKNSSEYEFESITVGTLDGEDFGGKREKFYSDFIKHFEQTRRKVVKEELSENYKPTFLLSLFY